jgi:hypothetical protein
MKKILFSCLLLSSLFADTSKVRIDKIISEGNCKAFYNLIMPINARSLIYNADVTNKVA